MHKAYFHRQASSIIVCHALHEHLLNIAVQMLCCLLALRMSWFSMHQAELGPQILKFFHYFSNKFHSTITLWYNRDFKNEMSRSSKRHLSYFFFYVNRQRTQHLLTQSWYTIIHSKLPRHRDCILMKSICPRAKCHVFRTDWPADDSTWCLLFSWHTTQKDLKNSTTFLVMLTFLDDKCFMT